MTDRQPIPVLVRVHCKSCGGESVVQKGQQVLCQNCVNAFLAKNIGLMEEEKEEPQFIGAGEAPLPPNTYS